MNLVEELLRQIDNMPQAERNKLYDAKSKVFPDLVWFPNLGPQIKAYKSPADELFYGGSAGGG